MLLQAFRYSKETSVDSVWSSTGLDPVPAPRHKVVSFELPGAAAWLDGEHEDYDTRDDMSKDTSITSSKTEEQPSWAWASGSDSDSSLSEDDEELGEFDDIPAERSRKPHRQAEFYANVAKRNEKLQSLEQDTKDQLASGAEAEGDLHKADRWLKRIYHQESDEVVIPEMPDFYSQSQDSTEQKKLEYFLRCEGSLRHSAKKNVSPYRLCFSTTSSPAARPMRRLSPKGLFLDSSIGHMDSDNPSRFGDRLPVLPVVDKAGRPQRRGFRERAKSSVVHSKPRSSYVPPRAPLLTATLSSRTRQMPAFSLIP
eukprot:g56565.t1